MSFFENKEFNKIDFTIESNFGKEYYRCKFVNCNLENTDLSGILFEECEFITCNLSGIKVKNTSLRDVLFKDCKILGVDFNTINAITFEIEVENSTLNFSSFYQISLKNIKFINVKLHEVDFTESNLEQSSFENCEFNGSIFENTNLKNADLSSSYGFIIDPEQNNLMNCKISKANLVNLLTKYKLDIVD